MTSSPPTESHCAAPTALASPATPSATRAAAGSGARSSLLLPFRVREEKPSRFENGAGRREPRAGPPLVAASKSSSHSDSAGALSLLERCLHPIATASPIVGDAPSPVPPVPLSSLSVRVFLSFPSNARRVSAPNSPIRETQIVTL